MLSTIMHSFFLLALVTVAWVVVGYSLAFGPDQGGVIGSLRWALLSGVGTEPNPTYSATIPHLLFMAFQGMFAVITSALITGSFAERKRFGAFVLFSLLWSVLVYSPLVHWVWGDGGWLRNLGALDFAGGTVVHIASGVSALVCAVVLGHRSDTATATEPHNATLTMLGAGLLWFGWFGFNAGSALSASELAVVAFVNTNIAAATGVLAWTAVAYLRQKRLSVLGSAAGAIAGLVAITPAAGYVTAESSLIIGFIGGLGCYFAVEKLVRGRVDDALDVFGLHGAGGILGALLTGVFATTAVNPAGADGLLAGNPRLVSVQLTAVLSVGVYSAVCTWALLKLVNFIVPLRVSAEAEAQGLDRALHGEDGYAPGSSP